VSQVEYEIIRDGVVSIRMNRPERLNALGEQLTDDLATAWTAFEGDPALLVAILSGEGRAFCSGEDLVEAAERGKPGLSEDRMPDPFLGGEITKPTIVAVQGWAVGGGVAMTAMATLRVATRTAVFEYPQVRHWGVGAVHAGVEQNMPLALAAELAFGFRVSGQRAYEMGFVNRLCDHGEEMGEALRLAEHLMRSRPQTILNTVALLRRLRPELPEDIRAQQAHLLRHGIDGDLMETRRAFANR
jgi:enoyl-CoA hydratase/carnithine racemase